MTYYITEEFNPKDNYTWTRLLNRFIGIGDAIEFNILYHDNNLKNILDKFKVDFLETGRRKNKIYSRGKYVRFKMSTEVKEFIFSKTYKSWKNFCLEDISILKDGEELFATITHENCIYITGTQNEIDEINSIGFKFERPFELKAN